MWYMSGFITGAGTLHWQLGGGEWSEDKEEGVTITFGLGSSSKFTSLLDKRQQRQRLEKLGRALDRSDVSWIVPGDKGWSFNLDVVKDILKEPFPEVSLMDWFKGQVSIEPEIRFDEREVFDELRYEAAMVFRIVPEVMNAKDSELPQLKFPPVEIQESLARFKQEHPDPSKVAFIMMQFGKTPAHTAIVEAIKGALEPHDIVGLRADDKQYHDDLFPNVMTYIYGCGFGIAVFERLEAEEFNPNVALEVGYMFGLCKPVCLLKDRTLKILPADLVGKLYKEFDPQNPTETIPKVVSEWLSDKRLIAMEQISSVPNDDVEIGGLAKSAQEELIIHSATYGVTGKTKDVTQLLNSKISEGRLEIRVCNPLLGGDPVPGTIKDLKVTYFYAGQTYTKTIREGEDLILP